MNIKRRCIIVLVIAALAISSWVAIDWFGIHQSAIAPGTKVEGESQHRDTEATAAATPVPYHIEAFASGLQIVWSMVFTSADRMLLTERPGRIRVIENGELVQKPFHVFPEVSTRGEEGLMSLALDPNYEENKWVYVSLAYATKQSMAVKVVRFRDENSHLSSEQTLIDNIPAARFHAGCRIGFGPDGMLYITTGDASNPKLSQEKTSLAGKILRIHPDGSLPNDNPFPDSPIWSYGHRNPQGIAWSKSGILYSSEHGPSVFDGPAGGDEINRIVKGGNYGWPLVSHARKQPGMISPLLEMTPAEAPASLMIYSGKIFPQFTDHLFFGALVGEGIVRIQLSKEDPDKVLEFEKLDIQLGRIREVIEGPDGLIYFSTSNRDGRGSPHQDDDRIFRIAPGETEA